VFSIISSIITHCLENLKEEVNDVKIEDNSSEDVILRLDLVFSVLASDDHLGVTDEVE